MFLKYFFSKFKNFFKLNCNLIKKIILKGYLINKLSETRQINIGGKK